MSTPSDVDRGPPSRRRGSTPPKKGSGIWKWACGGCAGFFLLGCVLLVVALLVGLDWIVDKSNQYWGGHPVLAKHPNTQSVVGVAYSPDGGRIATLTPSGTVWIWNAETGESILSIDSGMVAFHSLAFSPDGTSLAIGGQTRLAGRPGVKVREIVGAATVWDATTGKKLLTLEGHTHPARDIAYSPDGTRLATASGDNTAMVWDAKTGKELRVLKGHSQPVWSVAFSPDGSRLVTGSGDGTVRLWDAATGEEERKIESEIKVAVGVKDPVDDDISDVQFSSDGKQVWGVAKSGFWTWDAATGDKIRSTSAQIHVPGDIAIHSGTNRLARAYDNWVTVWDLTTGEITHRLRTKPSGAPGLSRGRLLCVGFSPDGTRVVGGARDGTIRVWKFNE
jgi:WD40 repeat protein